MYTDRNGNTIKKNAVVIVGNGLTADHRVIKLTVDEQRVPAVLLQSIVSPLCVDWLVPCWNVVVAR
jgi:hypothetical protein